MSLLCCGLQRGTPGRFRYRFGSGGRFRGGDRRRIPSPTTEARGSSAIADRRSLAALASRHRGTNRIPRHSVRTALQRLGRPRLVDAFAQVTPAVLLPSCPAHASPMEKPCVAFFVTPSPPAADLFTRVKKVHGGPGRFGTKK